ncbi:MAG: dihydrofolate reductase [Candidatus Pseudobacter hemicellulosilyticus]|uniref:Dihydrofolate reductase n=1 Tax=Candidatus Pseudobacter hemicellulosilyticus TaxID=3121375 RepID=A0AAJ5WTF9_9BACT|nr:MAG: dihydrofolate reductase [Pseudobacter sp.]
MLISFVVAAAENNVIGKDNQLLWSLPNDMKFFKNTTWGMPVVMGRKTWASMGGRPLAGRTNIVITRKADWTADGAVVVNSLDQALEAGAATDAKEVMIIGGGEIFHQAMPLVQKIYLTRVHTNIDGDAFFPEIRNEGWELLSDLDFPADEKHAYAYSFQVWQRKGH